ncbi:uncharacterized protein P174DRAFT_193904 [Aspergillus novofumigatus IBT 16806]|uniref:Uncharacterized protein n=1 Tax=Aspergillus novofumigatus (strain IBT 16806) TaxID=1392255 RepID=A0A2I1CAT6_ASPN1|nr:uncharacterized protein P174DRAFT_193904 [Aspergillus novofumigatus IBT 16806]PKX94738.1 hypothetical protein P174DRAFT_193904 [Aspergillus novofumigatus IBT 16806]
MIIIPDHPDFLRFIMTSSRKIRLPNIQHGTRDLAGSIEWSLIALGSGIHRDRVTEFLGMGFYGCYSLLIPSLSAHNSAFAFAFYTSGFCSLFMPYCSHFIYLCMCLAQDGGLST